MEQKEKQYLKDISYTEFREILDNYNNEHKEMMGRVLRAQFQHLMITAVILSMFIIGLFGYLTAMGVKL